MNRFALIGFYRSLTRHKLYAALNIGGLAVGIAVFLVLGLFVRFETGYERWLPGYQNIYMLESRTNDGDPNDLNARQGTPVAAWSAIGRDLPKTIGTRIDARDATVLKDGIGVREQMALVDPGFFSVFALPVVAGDASDVLASPSNAVLTQRTARKYFGGGSAIGRTMTITYEGVQHSYRVAAVIADLPPNTDLDFDIVARKTVTQDPANANFKNDHQWNYGGPQTFVRLPSPEAASQFEQQLAGVVNRHAQSETPDEPGFGMALSLKPIADVHFETPGSKLTVATLGIVGTLTLVIAIVNYVNLATARAGLRAREVAMRKVLGADRATLARHYVGEAVATAALAAFVGLVLAEVGLPLVDAAAGLPLTMHYFGAQGVILPLIVLVVLVGVVAGIYPAIVLSRFPAAAVLASARSPGGGRAGTRVREALVVAQFAIAIAFVIGTMVLVAQTAHFRAADVGYDRQNLLVIRSLANDSLSDAQRDTVVHRLAGISGVEAISVGNSVPGHGFFTSSNNFAIPGVPGPGPSIQFFEATPGFFDVVRARLLAGRLFDPSRPADFNANLDDSGKAPNGSRPANVILNESAMRALHIAAPQAAIGKTFGGATPRTIIGVVADMRFESPRQPVPPTMYDFARHNPASPIALIRYSGDPKAILDQVKQVWQQTAAGVPLDAATAVKRLDRYYAPDDHAANLFTIGAVLAVLIGCVGLWGLASFNTARRTKEIGIRKTLGASSADIVKLLVGQFLRPVLIANLFAWPMAFFAMRTWLAGFDDRIALSPLYFVAATALALAIAVLTVLAQSLRAARAAPAWALRHD
jgi:putative ABC transport system permease protein